MEESQSHQQGSGNEARGFGKQQTPSPYIIKAVASGLQLEDRAGVGGSSSSNTAKDTKPRRQSLSQRLGLQSLKIIGKDTGGDKGKTTSPVEYATTSSSPQSTVSLGKTEEIEEVGANKEEKDDVQRQASSLPKEHRVAEEEGGGGAAAAAAGDNDSGDDSQRQQKRPGSAKQRGVKVECVEMVGEDMYIGTSDGRIVHYTVATAELETNGAPERFEVSSVDLNLGGKKVEQMIAFPALSKLVVLCGSTVVFYRLPDLRPVPANVIPAIKGVSCIAYDERINNSKNNSNSNTRGAILCVARMRGVYIYRLTGELRLEQEIPMEHSVASICQYGGYVCLADTETYRILDLAKIRAAPGSDSGHLVLMPTQQPTTDPHTGRIIRPPRPRTLVVGPNEFMFLTSSGDRDTLGVIVTAMGEALRGTLQFSSYPKSITYDEPYVIAVFGGGQIEVFDTRMPDQTLVQTLFDEEDVAAGRPRRICTVSGFYLSTNVSRPEVLEDARDEREEAGEAAPISAADVFGSQKHWRREILGDNNPKAAENRAGRALSRFASTRIVVVAQDTAIYALAHPPQLVRVDALLLGEGRVEEAVDMVERAMAADPDSDPNLSDEAAYCFQVAGAVCFRNLLLDDALRYFKRGSLDPRALIHLFPDLVSYLGTLLVPLSRIPLAGGLRRALDDIGDAPQLAHTGAALIAGSDNEDGDIDRLRKTLAADVLELAQRYLEHCRTQMLGSSDHQMPFAPDSLPVIDTALVRLYAENEQDAKLRALVGATDNAVVSDLACKFLMDTGHYYHCSLLYKARTAGTKDDGSGSSARTKILDIWHRLLAGEWEDRRFGGFAEYLAYVRSASGDQHELLDEYRWLVDHGCIDASLQLLAMLSDESVASIDADHAIQATEQATETVINNTDALRTLVERLVSAAHPRAAHYTTYLVKAYVRQIRDYYADGAPDDDAATVLERAAIAERDSFACAQASDLALTFRTYLRSMRESNEGTRLRVLLIDTLLCANSQAVEGSYDARQTLDYVADVGAADLLMLERAILLVVLGQIDSAVDLLVNKLGDYAEAELLLLPPLPSILSAAGQPDISSGASSSSFSLFHLCPATTPSAASSRPDNVRKLLAIYLELGHSGHDEIAVRLVSRLLDRHRDLLTDSPSSVLASLPAHWPYSVAEPFALHSLRRAARRERESAVVRSLRESLTFDAKTELAAETRAAGAILLDYSQTCATCKKLLGSSAFVFEPDTEQVKHISCT
ncbi:hypothetical protein H4217_002317 [Coemansia sp. RSA 1939]|nr:hypothetical protein H4217_002317 [Coemansia sp. RSA 1939]KAJ2617095.1 hypothetical protein EV177_000744 [Coemansia sp. RSA 1804]KAJ2694771.1 hypothetical protein GGH99_000509 [Coemansia sp. RSA 1285]